MAEAADYTAEITPKSGAASQPAALLGSWQTATQGASGSPTHSHTAPAGTNRALIAIVTTEDSNDARDLTTLSYGGQAMTRVRKTVADSGGFVTVGYIYRLDEAGIAAAVGSSFAFTWDTVPDNSKIIGTTFAEHVNQTTPVDGVGDAVDVTDTTNAINLASSLAVNEGDLSIYCAATGELSLVSTAPSGYTQGYELTAGTNGHGGTGGSLEVASPGTTNPTVTFVANPNNRMLLSVAIFKREAGGSTPVDVTSDVVTKDEDGGRRQQPLFVSTRGRDTSNPLLTPRAGAANFRLENDAGSYDPDTGLAAGDEISLEAEYLSTPYPLWYGQVSLPENDPRPDSNQVLVQGVGLSARLAKVELSTQLYEDVTVDQAIGFLLEAGGFESADFDLDVSAIVLQRWWMNNDNGFAMLQQLVRTAGPGATFYEEAGRKLVFKAASAIIAEARSTASQATISSNIGTSEPRLDDFKTVSGIPGVINEIAIDVNSRQIEPLAPVWSAPGAILVLANATTFIEATTPDPFKNAQIPLEGTDFELVSGSLDNIAINRTSGARVTIALTGGSSGAQVTGPAGADGLQLRAELLARTSTATIPGVDQGSQDSYGKRSLPKVWPEISQETARSLKDAWLFFRAQPRRRAWVRMRGDATTERMTQVLSREINDRLSIDEGNLSLLEDFYVTTIEQQSRAPRIQEGTLHLEAASDDDVWVLGTDAHGSTKVFWV